METNVLFIRYYDKSNRSNIKRTNYKINKQITYNNKHT